MTNSCGLVAVATLIVGLAEGATAQQTPESCEQTRGVVGAYFAIPSNATAAPIVVDDWCILTDIALGSGDPYSTTIGIETLRWQTEGAFASAEGTLMFPSAVKVKADGLRIGVTVGDPVMDYLLAAQRQPQVIDMDLDLKFDDNRRVLTLTELSADFPGDNGIRLRAHVDNIDASSLATLQASVFGASLNDLTLRIETNGMFETYLLMPLGQVLLGSSTDPAATVENFQTAAQGVVVGLPDTILAAPDKTALSALIADLPNPSGSIRLSIEAEDGIGITRLAPVVMSGMGAVFDNLETMLAGVTLTFDYQP